MLGVTLLGLGGAALILRRAARTQGSGGLSLTGEAVSVAERRTGPRLRRALRRARNPPGGVAARRRCRRGRRSRRSSGPSGSTLHAQRARGQRRARARRPSSRRAFATRGRAARSRTPRRTSSGCSTAAARPEPVELGHDAWTGPGTHDAMLLAAGGLLTAVEAVLDGELDNAFALLRPPGHHAERDGADGLLPLQQHRDRGALGAARARHRARGDRRLGRAPRQRDRGDLPRRPVGADDLAAPGRALPRRHAASSRCAARAPARARTSTSRCPPATGDDGYAHAFDERRRARSLRAFAPGPAARRRRPGRVGHRPARAHVDHRAGLPRARRPRRRARRRGCAAAGSSRCSRAATRCMHLPLANLAILEGLAGLPPTFAGTTRSASTCRAALRDVERDAVAAARRGARRLMLPRRARLLDRRGGQPGGAAAARGRRARRRRRGRRRLHRPVDRVARARRRRRTRASSCSRPAAAATGRAGATAASCRAWT